MRQFLKFVTYCLTLPTALLFVGWPVLGSLFGWWTELTSAILITIWLSVLVGALMYYADRVTK